MAQEYTFEQIYDAAKCGLDALYTIARNDIKTAWKKMNRTERYQAMRSLVNLHDIARHPDLYFSYTTTYTPWRARAEKFADDRGLTDASHAYYIVANPVTVSLKLVDNALSFSYDNNRKFAGGHWNWSNYYNLASDFMSYDYNCAKNNRYCSQRLAQAVIDRSKYLRDHAAEVSAHGIKREWLKFIHGFKQYNVR